MSINDAKCTVLSSFLTSSFTSFLVLTFVSCHAGFFFFFFFSNSLVTATFASDIFFAVGIGINLRTILE